VTQVLLGLGTDKNAELAGNSLEEKDWECGKPSVEGSFEADG
jgi:hypothetical protein